MSDADADVAPSAGAPLESPSQTPLFRTLNRDRYARQEKIRLIEGRTGRRLLCWIAQPAAEINKHDILPIGDLLDTIESGDDVDLMLDSPGGDADVAEKIVLMFRKRCGSLRVIVPESAKSAATLIAIAADEIVMGYPSELGPIDPQVFIQTPSGGWVYRPAHSFLDGLAQIKKEVEDEGRLSPAYFPVLQHYDPAVLDYCRKAIERSRTFAEKWLNLYQCKGNPELAKKIAAELGDVKKHLSHGAVIDHEEAARMGLKVLYLPPEDDLWDALWRLYADYAIALHGQGVNEIYESGKASVTFGG